MSNETPSENTPFFNLVSIYVKDISLETPNSPHIFNAEWKPEIDFDLQMRSEALSEPMYEVVLNLTVSAKLEDKTAFLIEVKQAGLFAIKGLDADTLPRVLNIACPTVLYPYLRETVTNLSVRGGFMPFMLPPINFEATYEQHLQQAANAPKEAANSPAGVQGVTETIQ